MGWFNNMKAKHLVDQVNNKECMELFNKAFEHFKNKQYDDALTIFSEVINKKPQDENIFAAASYYAGIIFMGYRDYHTANLACNMLNKLGGIHKKRANELMEMIQKAKAYDNNKTG
jgi:TolA-binding protein